MAKTPDIMDVAEKIRLKIEALEQASGALDQKGNEKARAIANYDKALAITLIRLRAGHKLTLDNHTIQNPPATIMEKIAKGMCVSERMVLEIAESGYKSTISKIRALEAALNGYQSIFRHLDKMR